MNNVTEGENMKKNLLIWQVGGIVFTAVFGTIFHFLYEWTGLNVVATICAVNESTWEHMKLIFVPSFIFAVIQSFFAKKDYECFWLVKLIGIIVGTLLIPTLFYTLSGAFGTLSALVNIAIFFIAVILQYLIELYLLDKIKCKAQLNWLYIGILMLFFVMFVIFTFYPPKLPLFLDPVTRGYGITK